MKPTTDSEALITIPIITSLLHTILSYKLTNITKTFPYITLSTLTQVYQIPVKMPPFQLWQQLTLKSSNLGTNLCILKA